MSLKGKIYKVVGGTILVIIGLALWYIDYLILNFGWSVGKYLGSTAVAAGATIIVVWVAWGILLFCFFVGIIAIAVGILLITGKI